MVHLAKMLMREKNKGRMHLQGQLSLPASSIDQKATAVLVVQPRPAVSDSVQQHT